MTASIEKKSPINIGIVGCGRISQQHFNAIADLPDQFKLVAVCDKNLSNLENSKQTWKVSGFTHIPDMLEAHSHLNAITLCTPSGLHAEQAVQIANASKHVVTEKPLATRWQDGLNMVKACDQNNVQLFVVKQNRYQPALQLLKQALLKKRFGRVYLVNVNVFWTRPQSYYNQATWRGTWELDGGAFMNQACHYVDLLDWLLGPVQSIHAMMSTLGLSLEVEDTGVLNIRWRSGTVGSMNVTMLTYPKNLESSITILGEKGTVKIGGLSGNQITHWEFSEGHPDDEFAKEHTSLTSTSTHDFHKQFYSNVASTLYGETSADIDGRAGLRTLEILIAAYISARDNKTVNLPLIH